MHAHLRGLALRVLLPIFVATTPFALASRRDPTPAPRGAAQDPASADAVKEQKVRELLAVTGTSKVGEQSMKAMVEAFRTMPNLPEGFAEKFLQLAKGDDLVEMIVPIYLKHVPTADLDALLTFWKSDVGKRWSSAQEVIQKESMAAGQKWGAEIGARAARELEQEKRKGEKGGK